MTMLNTLQQDLEEFISIKKDLAIVRREQNAYVDFDKPRTIEEMLADSPAHIKLLSFLDSKSTERLNQLVTVGDGGRDSLMNSRVPEQDLELESYYNEYEEEEERPQVVVPDVEFDFETDYKEFQNQLREISYVYLIEKPVTSFIEGRKIYSLY